MFQQFFGRRILCSQILEDFAAQSCHEHLYSAANAEHGYLPVVGQARQEQLACVALAVYAAQPGQRLLAEKKGVDVAAARKDYGVHAVERRKDYLRIIRGRKHYGNASCLLNAQVVAFGQFAAFIAEVSRYGNYRPRLMVWKTAVELAVACPDVEGFLLPVTIFHALCY